jgi:hypothetical protein
MMGRLDFQSMEAAMIYDTVSGEMISQKMNRIQEIIQDYDPDLRLAWIPPKERTAFDKFPFVLIHSPVGKPEYIAMTLKESEVNESLIARLFLHDNRNVSVLERLEAEEAARKILKYKEQMDAEEIRKELVSTIIKSPLNTYRGPNGVVYK